MELVRTYIRTPGSTLRVTGCRSGQAVDLSRHYSDFRSRASGLERLTATLDVYRGSNGTLTHVTSHDGTREGLHDLGDLINVCARDMSAGEEHPTRLA